MSDLSSPSYPHPLCSTCRPPQLPYHDLILRRFTESIRNRKNWTKLLKNRRRMSKLIQKAAYEDACAFSRGSAMDIICPVWDGEDVRFVIEELEGCAGYVEMLREGGCLIEPDVEGVWRCDGVDEELRRRLEEGWW
ncbi:hypothetical protein TWF481_010678 [Arthrobotrys musiformis]|uniref:Uncharacterized protein n=1 Tax=Arthrobotrys musiformis TaxID=47236 RepID=A0AAV9W1J8_9PEZI